MKAVSFSELGADVGLCLKFAECRKIQEWIGKDDWVANITNKIAGLDTEALKFLLDIGGMKGEERQPIDASVAIDKLGIVETANRALDAMCWIVRGKSLADYQSELDTALEGAANA